MPTILEQIQELDPENDHQRIVFLSTCYDFAFDTTRALELALYRTYCVPSISALLAQTGEFEHRPQKRYDDTDLIVSELMEHGYDSQRGRDALRKMNRIHSHYVISNDDFLYVLSTFVFEPIRWNQRFGWRPMCPSEKLALFHFWREVGRCMNISSIPHNYTSFEQFNLDYESQRFRFAPSNQAIGAATRDLFLSWFPRPLAPLIRPAIYALMDDALIAAFGFPRPTALMRSLVGSALKLRASLLRLLPPRKHPRLRTQTPNRTYPRGYTIDALGPPSIASGKEQPSEQG